MIICPAISSSQTSTLIRSRPSNTPICNPLATYFPLPTFDAVLTEDNETFVAVDLRIGKTGKVVAAKAVSRVPQFRSAAEASALKAKFRVTTNSGRPVEVRCRIIYRLPISANKA